MTSSEVKDIDMLNLRLSQSESLNQKLRKQSQMNRRTKLKLIIKRTLIQKIRPPTVTLKICNKIQKPKRLRTGKILPLNQTKKLNLSNNKVLKKKEKQSQLV